ncbi:AlpA family phage regulatory protein [Burkholderia sp. 3C]
MPPLVKIPADDLIDSWALCWAIARAVCPADDEPIVGMRCIARGRLPQRSVIDATAVATEADQSQQAVCSEVQASAVPTELELAHERAGQDDEAFFEFDLSVAQRRQLTDLLPSLPPLSYPISSAMIDSFMDKYRSHKSRPRWEPVFVSETDIAYLRLEQLRIHSEHLNALKVDLDEGRLIAVDSHHAPVSGLGIGSLILRKDAIAYLVRCHLPFPNGAATPGSVSMVDDQIELSRDERSTGWDSSSGGSSNAESVKTLRSSGHEKLGAPVTIVRLKQVERMTGLARSSIYNRMDSRSRYFDPTFPRSFPLGESKAAIGWYEHEIQEWATKKGKR